MPDQTLVQHLISSSSSQPETASQSWRERISLHFPYLRCHETEEYSCQITYHLFQSLVLGEIPYTPARKLLSEILRPNAVQKEVNAEEIIMLFAAIELCLKENRDVFKIANLLHYCLPSQLATKLYNYAFQGSNSIPVLYWALICQQPITALMLIGMTEEQLIQAIKFAATINAIDALAQLKEFNKDIDLTSACFIAIKRKVHSLVEKLLELGVDVKSEKFPLLHEAARTGDTDIVSLLLNYHANIHFPTEDGVTALHLAHLYSPPELVELLSTAQPFPSAYQSPFDPQIEATRNDEWNQTSPFHFFQPAPELDSGNENKTSIEP